MFRFMMSERLGDTLEGMYRTIYTGGGIEFGPWVVRLVHMLGQLVDAGMLTNLTRKRIEVFLTKNVNIASLEVISTETNDIVLINKEIHEQDSFELIEYITWITDELCSDSIMKKHLSGRNNYEGVKMVLNTYVNKKHTAVMKENWIDFHIYNNKVYFTKKEGGMIHLYVKELGEENLLFSSASGNDKEVQLVKEDLLNGRIFSISDGIIFVEVKLGYFLEIRDGGKGKCKCSRMKGHILEQLKDGRLVYINEDKLICLSQNGTKRVITENVHLGLTYIGDNEVYWKGDFEANTCVKNNMEEKICREMLWKGLILTLYDFDGMEFNNKIGNRLRFARFFDQLPLPFTISEIGSRLSEIEGYCYDGSVIKKESYVEVMSYLMRLEKEEFDENKTLEAMLYLLENMKPNPYKRIANNAGIELVNSFDYILGDINLLDDNSDQDEDCDVNMSAIIPSIHNNIDVSDLERRIAQKIAEFEAMEEEERKETKDEETKKKKDSKGRGSKKTAIPDEIGRSAEGNNKLIEE